MTRSSRAAAICLATIFGCSSPTSAFSQTEAIDQKAVFNAFILAPSYRNFVEESVNQGENLALKAECATLKVLKADGYDIVDQPVFEQRPAGTRLVSGAWVAIARVDRCGQTTTRRLLLKYVPEGNRFQVTNLLPGDFGGNLKLEFDAYRIVTPGLMAQAKCSDRKQLFMLDVQSLSPPGPGGWSEVWKAQACGTMVGVRVEYSPIPGGMNISAGPIAPSQPVVPR